MALSDALLGMEGVGVAGEIQDAKLWAVAWVAALALAAFLAVCKGDEDRVADGVLRTAVWSDCLNVAGALRVSDLHDQALSKQMLTLVA